MEGDVRYHHVMPELRIAEARRAARRWAVFHETYSFALIGALESGPIAWRYNHRTYALDPDHLVMAVQPGELHAHLERSPPMDFIVVVVAESLMASVAHDLGWRRPRLNVKHAAPGLSHPAMIRALGRFRAGLCTTLFRSSPPGVCECATNFEYFSEALEDVVEAFIENYAEDGGQIVLPSQGAAVLRKAKEYLRDNHREPYSLDKLAEAAGCDKYYLLHVFKQDVGVTPSQYQTRILVARSCEQLVRFPDRPLERVARDVGWPGRRAQLPSADISDRVQILIRHFRETIGLTPGRYKATAQTLSGSLQRRIWSMAPQPTPGALDRDRLEPSAKQEPTHS
jgi:AraC-like DNA-binding protein